MSINRNIKKKLLATDFTRFDNWLYFLIDKHPALSVIDIETILNISDIVQIVPDI